LPSIQTESLKTLEAFLCHDFYKFVSGRVEPGKKEELRLWLKHEEQLEKRALDERGKRQQSLLKRKLGAGPPEKPLSGERLRLEKIELEPPLERLLFEPKREPLEPLSREKRLRGRLERELLLERLLFEPKREPLEPLLPGELPPVEPAGEHALQNRIRIFERTGRKALFCFFFTNA
jgi:hypothetical protein